MGQNIIIISGRQFSGKDTLAKILLKYLKNFERIGLADAIKREYAKEKGLTVEEIEKNKSEYRADLIDLGNKGRAISQDYWIENILNAGVNVIVPDVRVPHEVERFKENNAFCIRIEAKREERAKRSTLTKENDYTETALDNYDGWNYTILNEGSIEDLEQKAQPLLDMINQHFNK